MIRFFPPISITLSGREQVPRQFGTRASHNLIEESHEPVIMKLNSGEKCTHRIALS